MIQWRARYALIGTALVLTALAATAAAQHSHGDAAKPSAPPPPGSRRVTMEDLHRGGGVPRGWKFTLPPGGDAARGKQLFADLECFKCHQVEGAGFPPPGGDGKVGPPLTGAGREHPAEYFAESILSPNAIVVDGPGFIGPDGRSIMPSFADSLSVTQLLDLVAFVKSQVTGHGDHEDDDISYEREAGPYRVRLVFAPGDHGGSSSKGAHAHGGHAVEAARPAAAAGSANLTGHLMVFVTDATTGEAIPYLPITAAIRGQGTAARTIKLAPMLGPEGFHYGADATLAANTRQVVVSVGPPTLRVTGNERARYGKPQSVTFEWGAPAK
jgi:mono/diheme cytochrome c family protein